MSAWWLQRRNYSVHAKRWRGGACACCTMSSWEELSKARLRVHSRLQREVKRCVVWVFQIRPRITGDWRVREGAALPSLRTNHWDMCVSPPLTHRHTRRYGRLGVTSCCSTLWNQTINHAIEKKWHHPSLRYVQHAAVAHSITEAVSRPHWTCFNSGKAKVDPHIQYVTLEQFQENTFTSIAT